MGYLPQALCNYLLRLGWSHGDDEIISRDQAIAWFSLDAIGKSPSRLDFAKLDHVNAHYMRETPDAELARLVAERLGAAETGRLERGMAGLKARAQNLKELAEHAAFYVAKRPLALHPKAEALLDPAARGHLAALGKLLREVDSWNHATLEACVREYATQHGMKLGAIAQPLRAALTGSVNSPGLFEVMEVLDKEETLGRISDVTAATSS
jgi:glutamyl-tRNA synthetase